MQKIINYFLFRVNIWVWWIIGVVGFVGKDVNEGFWISIAFNSLGWLSAFLFFGGLLAGIYREWSKGFYKSLNDWMDINFKD